MSIFPKHGPAPGRSIPGKPEIGDRCPNCDWPIPDPKATALVVPSRGNFVCEHCGWTLSAPRHGADDHTPRPGRP